MPANAPSNRQPWALLAGTLLTGLVIGFWLGHSDPKPKGIGEPDRAKPVQVEERRPLTAESESSPNSELRDAPLSDDKNSLHPEILTPGENIAHETAVFLHEVSVPGEAADREAFANAWIARCLRSGDAGIAELRQWLASGRDLSFETGTLFSAGGDDEETGEVRSLILSSMERWPKADAVAVATEILQDSIHTDELSEAIRQLDLHEPGQHQAEIKSRLRELLDREPGALDLWLEQAAKLEDSSMIGEVQAKARDNPAAAGRILATAYALPSDKAQAALRRLAADPSLLRNVVNNTVLFSLPDEAYHDSGLRTFTVQTLFPAMNAETQERLLSNVGNSWIQNGISPNAIDVLLFGSAAPSQTGATTVFAPPMSPADNQRNERLERLAFLDLLSPSIHDPKVRGTWLRAREELQRLDSGPTGRPELDRFPIFIRSR